MDKNIKIEISVIIATFNGFEYIKEAIDSVLSQTYKNLEIIVVDDGSTDIRLKEVLLFYISNNLIKYIYKENGGQGSARNEGIKVAQGKYIAFLDDDDYWSSDKLEKQFSLLENNPDNIVCYTDAYFIDCNGVLCNYTNKDICGNFYSGDILREIIFKNFITLSSSVVKKEVLLKNGLFNESDDLRRLEDYDLWLRLSTLGNFCFVDEPLVFYRTKESLKSIVKVGEYRKILNLFELNIINSKIKYKIYYILGWVFYFTKFIYFKFKNIL